MAIRRLGLAYSPGAMAFAEAPSRHESTTSRCHSNSCGTRQRRPPAGDDPDRAFIAPACRSPGFVPPSAGTVEAIRGRGAADAHAMAGRASRRSSRPTGSTGPQDGTKRRQPTLTYTVCPQLSEETLASSRASHKHRSGGISTSHLILENPPLYFSRPGSTMRPRRLHRRGAGAQRHRPDCLDLTRF